MPPRAGRLRDTCIVLAKRISHQLIRIQAEEVICICLIGLQDSLQGPDVVDSNVEDVDFGQLFTFAAAAAGGGGGQRRRQNSLLEQVKGRIYFAHALTFASVCCSPAVLGEPRATTDTL